MTQNRKTDQEPQSQSQPGDPEKLPDDRVISRPGPSYPRDTVETGSEPVEDA
jgi:hypothetical protein